LRTTNPIEGTFATVRHRTIRSKGCLSNRTALAMVFKLVEAAQKTWRRLDGNNQLPKLILGVKFADGLEVAAKPANREPATVAAWSIRPSPKIGDSSSSACAATFEDNTDRACSVSTTASDVPPPASQSAADKVAVEACGPMHTGYRRGA
jgi:hypothetical protein